MSFPTLLGNLANFLILDLLGSFCPKTMLGDLKHVIFRIGGGGYPIVVVVDVPKFRFNLFDLTVRVVPFSTVADITSKHFLNSP